jgi:hypothetical protein
VYAVSFSDLPIDSWWGISVYNAEGYFEKNDRDVYTVNSINAVANDDGSYTVQFGGCDVRRPTACRSSPAGTTPSGSTCRGRKSSTGPGPYPAAEPV